MEAGEGPREAGLQAAAGGPGGNLFGSQQSLDGLQNIGMV